MVMHTIQIMPTGKHRGNWLPLLVASVIVMSGHAVGAEATSDRADSESSVAGQKKQVVEAMREAFGDNKGQIAHAMRVLDCSERLLDVSELKADRLTVAVAAILHDIGRAKAGTTDHEKDGAVIGRRLLTDLGFAEGLTDHVSRIIGSHHSAKGIDTPEFRIVWIADRLVNGKRDHQDKQKLKQEYAKEVAVLNQKIEANKALAR